MRASLPKEDQGGTYQEKLDNLNDQIKMQMNDFK